MRARRWVVALLVVVVTGLVGPAPAAQAHAFLETSSPADGQVLTTPPTELLLDFSEPIVLSATAVDIVDGDGRHLEPRAIALESRPGAAAQAPVEVVVVLPDLERGTFQVSWETLSGDDLHRTTGVIVFGVSHAVTAAGLDEPPPPPLEAGLRWLLFLGLSGALGGALAGRLLLRAGGPGAGSAALTARTLAACGALVAAGVAVIVLVTQLLASGTGVTALLWGPYGVRWGLRELGLLALVAALTAPAASRRSPARTPLIVAGGVLTCLGTALLGHSGAGAATNLTRVAASAAHLGAAATWAGAVVVLALVLFGRGPGRLGRGSRGGAAGTAGTGAVLTRAVLRLFGLPAAGCVTVLVVTGVYLSSEVVGSVDAALFTIYGRTLLLKVALAGVAGALALVNTRRLHGRAGQTDSIVGAGRPGRDAPRRTVQAEAVVAVAILVLAGILTAGQPAMEPQLTRAESPATVGFLDRTVADLQETVALSPNGPGPNVLSVDVFNTRRPAPARITAVQVSLTTAAGGETALTAAPLANGRWSVHTTLGEPGPVTIQVTVLRDGLPDATASYDWTVGGLPDQTRAAVVSTAPIGPVLRLAATALLGAALALWFAALLRRRSRRGGTPTVEPELRDEVSPLHADDEPAIREHAVP